MVAASDYPQRIQLSPKKTTKNKANTKAIKLTASSLTLQNNFFFPQAAGFGKAL